MIISPAIDIKNSMCVQLVGGDPSKEIFSMPDPVLVARSWIDTGFTNLHVVDLDRAFGETDNLEVIKEICLLSNEHDELNVRVGGGIRTIEDIEEILIAGASSVVLGTQAIVNPFWFIDCASRFPQRLYVALEVDQREVKINGWQQKSQYSLEELAEQFDYDEIGGLFITAIHVEGRQNGTDFELFKYIRSLTTKDIIASGGITTKQDIEELESIGINEIVVGAAFYGDEQLKNDALYMIKEEI